MMRGEYRTTLLPPAALVAAAMLVAGPSPAGNESRFRAYAAADGLIEVVADFSENAIYWCGAGTYAQSRLGQPGTARLYVWQGPSGSTAEPGERAVRFGLSPPPGAPSSGALTTDVRAVGNSMSVAQARQACNERTSSG